ncbi:PEP-CTERM sorting domain-containing protein [Citromicrobium bathyomarinum]|uniref:PEP-CTERM sorting domain-containing protein n=1 Tax=Citromicrobium bathyomarinum TaxID=72174 RepID=UPI00315A898F
MLFGLAGIAVMAIATPAPTAKAPPAQQIEQVSARVEAPAPVKVPAPPVVILFGLAAGAMLVRRKFF